MRRPGTTLVSPSLLAECTAIIYRRRASAIYSHVPIIALAVAIGWDESVRALNLALVGLLAVYMAVAIVSGRIFLAGPQDDASARFWARALYVKLAVLAIIYNAIFLNLDRHGVAHAVDYLTLLFALFSAGGAASYQHLRGLAVVYILFAMTPLALYHLLTGGSDGRIIAIVLVVFIVFMSNTSQALHREAIERLRLTRELKAARDVAENAARTDGLTGLQNRRALLEMGEVVLAGAQRYDRPLSVLMLDVDHFKSINDRFGHAAGDAVLVALAETLRANQRTADLIGRLGGEEFAILMPETDATLALEVAQRMREAIRAIAIAGQPTITASIGVAEREPQDAQLDSLLARADRALYLAKAQGRDRAVLANDMPVPAAI